MARVDATTLPDCGSRKGETCLIRADCQEICYTMCSRSEGRLVTVVDAPFKGVADTGRGEIGEQFFVGCCRAPGVISAATAVS